MSSTTGFGKIFPLKAKRMQKLSVLKNISIDGKIETIAIVSTPKNCEKLRSYMRAIQYFVKFLLRMAQDTIALRFLAQE